MGVYCNVVCDNKCEHVGTAMIGVGFDRADGTIQSSIDRLRELGWYFSPQRTFGDGQFFSRVITCPECVALGLLQVGIND